MDFYVSRVFLKKCNHCLPGAIVIQSFFVALSLTVFILALVTSHTGKLRQIFEILEVELVRGGVADDAVGDSVLYIPSLCTWQRPARSTVHPYPPFSFALDCKGIGLGIG